MQFVDVFVISATLLKRSGLTSIEPISNTTPLNRANVKLLILVQNMVLWMFSKWSTWNCLLSADTIRYFVRVGLLKKNWLKKVNENTNLVSTLKNFKWSLTNLVWVQIEKVFLKYWMFSDHCNIHVPHMSLFPKGVFLYPTRAADISHQTVLDDILLNIGPQPIQFHMCFPLLTFYTQIEYAILWVYLYPGLRSTTQVWGSNSESVSSKICFTYHVVENRTKQNDINTSFSSFNTNGWGKREWVPQNMKAWVAHLQIKYFENVCQPENL